MSYDAKFTITRDKLSLTVEAKAQTVQDLHFLAAAVWENNLQNIPWLIDQFFVQLEYAVAQQKKKQEEMIRAGGFQPAKPVEPVSPEMPTTGKQS